MFWLQPGARLDCYRRSPAQEEISGPQEGGTRGANLFFLLDNTEFPALQSEKPLLIYAT
jgi:hypothetical protein